MFEKLNFSWVDGQPMMVEATEKSGKFEIDFSKLPILKIRTPKDTSLGRDPIPKAQVRSEKGNVRFPDYYYPITSVLTIIDSPMDYRIGLFLNLPPLPSWNSFLYLVDRIGEAFEATGSLNLALLAGEKAIETVKKESLIPSSASEKPLLINQPLRRFKLV